MQSKNLISWSGLFSVRSRFVIGIKPSRYSRVVYGAALLTVLTLLFSPMFGAFILWPWSWLCFLIFAGLFLNCPVNCPVNSPLNSVSASDGSSEYFILTTEGDCQFAAPDGQRQNYILQGASRAGFSGFWLVLLPQLNDDSLQHLHGMLERRSKRPGDNNPGASNKAGRSVGCCVKFIFKDSLSQQDCARLSRVLKQQGRQT